MTIGKETAPARGQLRPLSRTPDGGGLADDHEGGTVIAVFPTIDGSFRYAVDTEGYGALQFFTEEKLVLHSC